MKVTGRQARQTKPFAEVQEELRKKIAERQRAERIEQILADAMTGAVIETIFDEQEGEGERQVSPVSGEKTASSR